MSANYHAFQNQGFLFSTFEAICDQWHAVFSDYDPSRIADILGLAFDEDYLYLSYYQTPYRLRLKDGVLEKKQGEIWDSELFFNEAMSVYHLLHYTKDHPHHAGVWVSSEEADSASSHRARTPDPLLVPFAAKYAGRTAALDRACRALGGTPFPSKGDVSYEFEAFPQIPLRMIFWDMEDDFPAQVQILVDRDAMDYIHVETLGCIISDLFVKLSAQEENI